MTQTIAGAQNSPKRRIDREFNKRIQRLVAGYQNDDVVRFLREISYNLS